MAPPQAAANERTSWSQDRVRVQDAEQDAKRSGAERLATKMISSEPDLRSDKLNQERLQAIERQLASVIGPLARMLVKRAAAKTSSVLELYEILAGDLELEEDRKKFLANSNLSMREARTPSSTQVLTDGAPPADLPSAPRMLNEITPLEIDQAAQALAAYLGPIALVLAKKEAKDVGDLRSLYKLLAEHIVEPIERDRFLTRAGIKDE
jgi:serine/threonine-protein kinase